MESSNTHSRATKEGTKTMSKVYIFGRGLGYTYVKKCLRSSVEIVGYIDNYAVSDTADDGKLIKKQSDDLGIYDYIIVSIMKYKEIVKGLINCGIDSNKIICFFAFEDAENEQYTGIFDQLIWKAELAWKHDREVVWPAIDNLFYELYTTELEEKKQIPNIVCAEETIELLVKTKSSLVRFGDGEFEMILNRLRLRYQNVDENLSTRLKEILQSNIPNLMVAIADNYGKLDKYTDEAAQGIRSYLTPSVRKEHISLLDMDRVYYDAYLSRPYLIYRDKSESLMKRKFDLLKRIWQCENVLIIEGEHTRIGVANDLMDNAKRIERILVPDKNAYSVYNEILKRALEYGNNKLVLCCVGPTATVLSYDLALRGYRAVDIGQIDTEYEWFKRKAENRCDIPYKTVSEYVDKKIYDELNDKDKEKYNNEIVCIIRQ